MQKPNSVNGNFENPAANPFFLSVSLSDPLYFLHTSAIVPSSTAPATYPDLCNYVLEYTYLGGANTQTTVFAYILPIPVLIGAGQLYSISFDTLACGSGDSSWSVAVDTTTIGSGFNTECGLGGAQWGTFSGTFITTGISDTVYISLTGDVDPSQNYFDNFVVLPLSVTPSASTSSASATPT